MYQQELKLLKKHLNISKALSIRFSDQKDEQFKKYKDTVCTSLLRSFIKQVPTYIDRQLGQACAGGNYFLKIKKFSPVEIAQVYIEKERVFKNNKICKNFIQQTAVYPKALDKKYILISPLKQEKIKARVIVLLVNPAQAGRIIGLANYQKIQRPVIIPGASTCASIYLPVVNNQINLNFIDYYDRYYQAKNLWPEEQLIISLTEKLFLEVVKNICQSGQGSYHPKLAAKPFAYISKVANSGR